LQTESIQEGNVPILDALKTFESPLFGSRTHFHDNLKSLDISSDTADILDDMKFLTTSVQDDIAYQLTFGTSQSNIKLHATSLWTRNRVADLPAIGPTSLNSTEDLIYETVRLTALLYNTAISSRSPFSYVSQSSILQDLWKAIWRISLSRWKKIPGIFLWVILVACASSKDKMQRRLLKLNLAAVVLHIEVTRTGIAVSCLRTFLRVQKWIKHIESKDVVEQGDKSVEISYGC
jgi:hypothetical protein